jgi:N-acetyl-anhydromuramyl-L-alanine amidase AmpD
MRRVSVWDHEHDRDVEHYWERGIDVPRVITKDSPNQSQREHGNDDVRIIVCHTPEGSWGGTIATIMNPDTEVSYHRLRSKNGKRAIQFVPWERKAWHAKTYNGFSDGLAIEGFARHFDLDDDGVPVFARDVAERLKARGLQARWTTDPRIGGVCRHGDLQSDRTDPTPDLPEWRLFMGMVRHALDQLEDAPPKEIPAWFWHWARWRLGGRKWRRPGSAPRVIPLWAWVKLTQMKREDL